MDFLIKNLIIKTQGYHSVTALLILTEQRLVLARRAHRPHRETIKPIAAVAHAVTIWIKVKAPSADRMVGIEWARPVVAIATSVVEPAAWSAASSRQEKSIAI